jgi:hypothetical protein
MIDTETLLLSLIGLVWIYGAVALFYLRKIACFNRDLHAVLLEKTEPEKDILHIRLQAPIAVWREKRSEAKPAAKAEAKPAEAKPAKPKNKIEPKTIAECEKEHDWVKDKADNYYCRKCGKKF